MISRCPSCAAEVDDDAARCPSCHWDFDQRRRIPPEGAAADTAQKQAAKPPEQPKPKLEEEAVPAVKPKLEEKSAAAEKPGAAVPASRPAAAAPREESEAPSPEPPPPLKFGFKQFSKAPAPEAPKAVSPATESHFAIPVLPSKKKEEQPEPPMTEIRRLPQVKPSAPAAKPPAVSGRTPAAPPKPAAPPGKTPAPAKTAEKEKSDPVDRFRKPSQPPEEVKAAPGPIFRLDPKIAAGAAALGVIIIVGISLTARRASAPKSHPTITPTPVAVVPTPAPVPTPIGIPAPPLKDAWTFEGLVYDLITLRPVPQAQVSFRGLGSTDFSDTVTDAKGRFKIILAPAAGGGYNLTAKHPDYLDGYIDEMDPPLKEDELDERRLRAASVARNLLWIGRANSTTKKDVILIPKVIPLDAQ